MNWTSIVEELKSYIAQDVLGGKDIGLDETTPLLEWGIINSLEMIRLLQFIRNQFTVDVPMDKLTGDSFTDIVSIANLVLEQWKVSQTNLEVVVPTLPSVEPDPKHRYEPFPTTDVQQAYWVGRNAAFEIGSVGNHGYIEVEATNLDLDRFNWALQRTIQRHDMLRAVLLPDGQQQILEQVPPFEIKIVDLRGQDRASQVSHLEQIRQTLDHQIIPIERWPAFELWISRLDDQQVRLHLSIESIFIDAWSMNSLIHEFLRLYHEPNLSLPVPSLSFRDYVLAEAALHSEALYQRSREYWHSRLSSLPPAPDLPLVSESERTWKRPHFVHREARLEREHWQRLKAHAAKIGVTPSGVLLTAFTLVIARWSKTARFSLNLSTFNRLPLHEQVNEIVGDFTTLLVLAIDHTISASFENRAKRIQEQLWQDLAHSSYSGIAVLRELVRMQGEGLKAIMPIVFTSLLIQDTASPLPPPWGKMLYCVSQTPQVWLDHQVLETEGELVFHWQSVDAIFPAGLIDTMFAAYCQLLQRLASVETNWSEDVETILPEQQRALLAHVNATEAPVSNKLLHSFFFEQVTQRPDQFALISPNRLLTYKQVYIGALQLAHQLRDWGACPNQLVGVVMEKGWEQVVAVLGILQSGAAYLPIDAHLPRERLWYLLEDGLKIATEQEPCIAPAPVVVTQSWIDRRTEWPKGVRRIWVDSLDLDKEDIPKLASVQSPDDLAYVIYTSGSTGVPKGVMIDHRGAVNTILDINRRFRVSNTDRVLALSALHFDLSVYDIFGILAAGGTLVLPNEKTVRDPAFWLKMIKQEQITIWNTVPAMLQMLVDSTDPTPSILQQTSLRLALLSGDWIPLSLPDQLKNLCPDVAVISLGGATEASIWSILYPITNLDPSCRQWSCTTVPYGKPMHNQRFFVLNEKLESCPVWVAGHLYIGGIGLARGYWRDEEKTQASFLLHPQTGERLYKTGDLGRYFPDGTIEFLGREDFQVKVAGHRIELGEIEATLLDHPLVRQAVVTAIGKPFENKHLIAYVVPSKQAQWSHSAKQTDNTQDSVNWETLVINSQAHIGVFSDIKLEDTFSDIWKILQEIYLQVFCNALNEFGVFGSSHEHYSLDELMQKCAIHSRYKKWVNRNIHFLVENGYLRQENSLFKREKSLPTRAIDELWLAYQKAASRLTDPTLLALGWHKRFPLMPSQTLENLKSVLTEELHSAEIYLSTETSEAYRIFHASNTMLQILMQEFVRLTSEHKKIRVLEIGAGFGTATAYILPTLPSERTEYIYTDISVYFLQEAQEKFADYPFVEYGLLDIEKNPQSQGYEMQDFDIIIAASVLHATANIVGTLTHVRSLLKPHGILLLLEETHFHQIFDLTMGLQQGFDRFADTELRQSHPLLSRDMWHEMLRKQGFASSAIFNKPDTLTDFLGFDVVLAQGPASASPLRLMELYQHLRSKLPEYMIPSRIVPLETLPLTSNGKIDRHALPDPLIQSHEHASLWAVPTSSGAARTPTEQTLVHLWSEILKRSDVGIDENFLELGGDSLLAAKLLTRVRANFSIEVPLQVMFQNPTIAVLAKTIEQAQAKQQMEQRSSEGIIGTGLVSVPPIPMTPTLSLDEEEGVL